MLHAFGSNSIDPSSQRIKPDQLMWIASCTKLLTTIAVLQCIERGQLTLDSEEELERLVPPTRNRQVLVGFDKATGQPNMKPAMKKNTLLTLLTHTSGYGYDFWPPLMQVQEALTAANDVRSSACCT